MVYVDTTLGVIADGLVANDNCWTGPHLHVETYNYADYCCFVDHPLGATVAAGTRIGRIGGADVTAERSPCP